MVGGPPSTHPSASAKPVIPDMPVCWPIPSSVQQKGSSTQATAAANQMIQNASAGGATAGEPMAQHDVDHCRNVFQMLLDMDSQQQANNPAAAKKREDIAKRLEDLYSRLASGGMKTTSSQKVLTMVQSIEANDFAAAKNLHKELTQNDWDNNRNWLLGVQRLINR